MPYLIDSDRLIDFLAQVPETTELFAGLTDEAFFISAMTYLEVFQGTLRGPASLHRDLLNFVEGAPILPVTREIAEECARLRQALLEQGKRPNRRAFDLVIAATAIEHELTLVTRNVRDDEDIPGLSLYRP